MHLVEDLSFGLVWMWRGIGHILLVGSERYDYQTTEKDTSSCAAQGILGKQQQ